MVEELLEKSQIQKKISAIGAGAPGVINKYTGKLYIRPIYLGKIII